MYGGGGKETGLGYSITYPWWVMVKELSLRIVHYISEVGMGRKLVKDILLYICGGHVKETGEE